MTACISTLQLPMRHEMKSRNRIQYFCVLTDYADNCLFIAQMDAHIVNSVTVWHTSVVMILYKVCWLFFYLAHGTDPESTPYNSLGSLIMFCVAGFINGVGYAPTYAMTMAYLDDNAPGSSKHSSSPYIG